MMMQTYNSGLVTNLSTVNRLPPNGIAATPVGLANSDSLDNSKSLVYKGEIIGRGLASVVVLVALVVVIFGVDVNGFVVEKVN